MTWGIEVEKSKQVALGMQGRQTAVDLAVAFVGVPPGPSLAALVGRNVFGPGPFFEVVTVLGVDLDQEFDPDGCFVLGRDCQQTLRCDNFCGQLLPGKLESTI